MKIKSSDYWAMRDELDSLRSALKGQQSITENLRVGQQEWRAKFEALQSGGVDGKLERENAFERGRQHALISVRGGLIEALNNLVAEPADTEPAQPFPF